MLDFFRNLKERIVSRARDISERTGRVFREWVGVVDGFLDAKWTRAVNILDRFRDKRNFVITLGIMPLSTTRLTKLRREEGSIILRINTLLGRVGLPWRVHRIEGRSIFVNHNTIRFAFINNPLPVALTAGILALLGKYWMIIAGVIIASITVAHLKDVVFRANKTPTVEEVKTLTEMLPEEDRMEFMKHTMEDMFPEARPGMLENIRNIIIWVVIAVVVVLAGYVIYQHKGFKK